MDWHAQNVYFNALIKQLFHDENWQKRSEAARQLGFLRDGRAVNLLCRALKTEEDFMVWNRIIEALGRIGDGKATLRIIEKLKEEINKQEYDRLKIIYILESLKQIKDKRSLVHISYFLNSQDKELKKLSEEAFDTIEPNWRQIVEKERKEKSFEDIFKPKT